MMLGIAHLSDPRWPDLDLWLAAYVSVALLLAMPATYVATRRGIWPGILAGIATYVGLGLLGLVTVCILAAILGGGAFDIGFAELIVLGWMAMFLVPTLLLGLVLAAFVRWRSPRPSRRPAPDEAL